VTDPLVFTYHQSFLGEYQLCPERARYKWFGLVPDGPTDATAIGTGVHAGIEWIVAGNPAGGAWEASVAALEEELADEHFRWVQVKTKDTALRHMATALNNLVIQVVPKLGTPIWIEQSFNEHLQTIELPDGRTAEIRLAGTADFADEAGLWDWKTRKADSTKYKAGWGGEGWKLKRFGIQPTVYTWAADKLGLWEHLGVVDEPWTFTFAASSKTSNEVDELPVERTPRHVEWLKQLTTNVTVLLSSGLAEYPKIDQHALCSPEWCPAWSVCKGRDGSSVTT